METSEMNNSLIRWAAIVLVATLAACGSGDGSVDNKTDHELVVTVIGPTTPAPTDRGRVTSQPLGIDCGATCNATFVQNTVVLLTAAAPAGQQFSAWSGACSGSIANCTVTMSESRAVTATFAPASGGIAFYALSVAATGSGTVLSQPAGINCGSACSANFADGTVVVLTAAPASGQVLSSWGGTCSGSAATCSVVLSAARSVTAAFVAAPPASGWSDAAVVSADGAGRPRVGVDAAGNATAIWLQIQPGTSRRDVWSSRRPVGGAWSVPATIESSETDVFELELAVDAVSGRAMAVWRGSVVTEIYARPADSSGVWGAAARINGTGSNLLDLQVGIDGNGNALAVWSQTPVGSTVTSIWSSRYSTASGWGNALRVAVAENDRQDLDPSLSLSANGRAFVVWTRNSSGVMASHAEAGGTWSTPTVLGAGQVSTGVGAPRVAADANGNAMAVWARGAFNSSNQFGTNLESKRYTDGAWSGAAAALYAPLVTAAGTDLVQSRLAVNGLGQFAAVWSLRDSSVQAAQSDAAGTWRTAATVRPASSFLLSGLPEIGIDGLGNLLATWVAGSDASSGRLEVYLNSFTPGSGWTQGSVHQTTPQATGEPRIAMNDRGNAVMVWTRNGSDGSRVISRSFTSGR